MSKIRARSAWHKSFSKLSKANITHCKHLIAYFDRVPLDVISTMAIYILSLREASFPTIMNQIKFRTIISGACQIRSCCCFLFLCNIKEQTTFSFPDIDWKHIDKGKNGCRIFFDLISPMKGYSLWSSKHLFLVAIFLYH